MGILSWLFRRSGVPSAPTSSPAPPIRAVIDRGGPRSMSITVGVVVDSSVASLMRPQSSGRRHTFMDVVGESHYQPALRRALRAKPDRAISVILQPEPTNPYDKNAVAVLESESRDTLGYLRREVATQYHAAIAARVEVQCAAQLTGGEDDKPSVGLVVDFAPVYEMPQVEKAKRTRAGTASPSSVSAAPVIAPKARRRKARIPEAPIGFRLANELEGLLSGITADHVITRDEIARLQCWLAEGTPHAHIQPFNELSGHLRAALADGELTLEECESLLFITKKYTRANPHFDQMRGGLQVLMGLLAGLATDGQIGSAEMHALAAWATEWSHLKGLWPYDEVHAIATAVLEDGSVTVEEVQHLRALEQQFPIAGRVGETVPMLIGGVCAVNPRITFDSKTFVLTGESSRSPRAEIESLIRRAGGNPEPRVTQRTDYLVVGAEGSPYWAFACYGRKIERAYELRKEGHPVVIAHERDFWQTVSGTQQIER